MSTVSYLCKDKLFTISEVIGNKNQAKPVFLLTVFWGDSNVQ